MSGSHNLTNASHSGTSSSDGGSTFSVGGEDHPDSHPKVLNSASLRNTDMKLQLEPDGEKVNTRENVLRITSPSATSNDAYALHRVSSSLSSRGDGAYTPGRSFPTPERPFSSKYYHDENLNAHKIKTALKDICNISSSDLTSLNEARCLLGNENFIRQLRPKDVLYIENNYKFDDIDMSAFWGKFEIQDFYMNYNNSCREYINSKFKEKPSMWSFLMLSYSHFLFLISIVLGKVLDILELFTTNYDLNFSPKVSVVMFSFVPKVPVNISLCLVALALLWPVVGVFVSPEVNFFARTLFESYMTSAKFWFSSKMNVLSNNVKSAVGSKELQSTTSWFIPTSLQALFGDYYHSDNRQSKTN